jgi:2-C-methyl-D-erythritol 2,4-cyclodiphosphate synthase
MTIRTGIGYDSHRFTEGRPLILGGVPIPHPLGLAGHSDADVVLHAIADAILGACALGDIGHHFPPSDPVYRDADSLKLLERVAQLAASHGFVIDHIDSMVIAEAPKIAPHVDAMRRTIATVVQLSTDSVSVKATTNEGMGFIGREEGIAALAVATVRRA